MEPTLADKHSISKTKKGIAVSVIESDLCSICRVQIPNKNIDIDILLNDLTQGEKKLIISQKYLTQIRNGDSRIIICNGIVHEKVLVRFPPKNDFRANLSLGVKYEIRNLPAKHKKYLSEIAEFLKMNRIYLAGVDMIGDFITEINITSPTGIQEMVIGRSKR